ncbi:MAG: nucleoside triphosphate pyrophosphohydrolase [Bacteriovoracaceae bacterium]|nr:nucleoside triphosphate pyrophosphohydrolase [Bacteriovoracaceae bacterium]
MNHPELEKLIQVVKELRDPDHGCPWDLKQTHKTLTKYLIEESFEFINATEKDDFAAMEEELGDVLLQILLHTTIGEEKNLFSLESVSKTLKEKMIRRHPHVFENKNTSIDASEVVKNWEKIKEEEKRRLGKESDTLITDKVLFYPALHSADKIGKATNKIKFDWDDASQVMYKVEEEWQELKEELAPQKQKNQEDIEEELGDFLFSTAQLARHLGINAEEALRNANIKFLRRFHTMEDIIKEDKQDILQMNQQEMDIFWGKAKKREKSDI